MTDAPKIDTQAPRWPDTTRLRLNRNGYLEPWPDGTLCYYGHFRTVVDGLVAELDRADAREAAIAHAMREAAASIVDARKSILEVGTELSDRIRRIDIPEDRQAALDRLIAERVREALEEAAKIVREEERRAKWDAQHQGHDAVMRARASTASAFLGVAAQMIEERARGSKEGRDG